MRLQGALTGPVINNQTIGTNKNQAVNITLSGKSIDNSPLTFSIVSEPNSGVLGDIVSTNSTSAVVRYTPNSNFTGIDSFIYKANDGMLDSVNNATVTITVNEPGNHLPIAVNDTATTDEDIPIAIDVLDNDSDVDNDPLSITDIITMPKNGSAFIV